MTLTSLARRAQKLASDNSPAILTAIGVTGTVTTAYLTGKAAYQAHDEILRLECGSDERYDSDYGMSFQDKVKETWTYYIPAVGSGAATVICIIAANRVGSRRAAAMAAAYSISEKAFVEYRDKVVEKLGDTKEQAIRDEVAQDRVLRNPADSSQILISNNSEVRCYDAYTGRYFQCSMERIKRAQNEINHQIINDGYASIGEFWSLIGLPPTSVADEVGWNADKLLDIEFSTVLSEDDVPCISIDFRVTPIRGYHKIR